jgi:hypothetical protein
MGKQSRRKRGREPSGARINERARIPVPPEMRAACLEALGDCPRSRAVMDEVLSVMESRDFWRVSVALPSADRAILNLALRDAMLDLLNEKRCDVCPATATRLRFMLTQARKHLDGVDLPRRADTLTGIATLCERCYGLPRDQLLAHQVKQLASYDRERDGQPYRRPTVIGQRIGGAGPLPRRHALQECARCGMTIWIDLDQQDQIESIHEPLFLCSSCAKEKAGEGGLELVFIAAGNHEEPS